MNDEQIVVFIKDLIIDHGKKIEEIASLLKVHMTTIHNILRQKHTISHIVREKVERYYKQFHKK